ncbi:hypothetical protein MY04_4500 [Flammeovirga sp. MY04]|uniref:hypothetical protein n=1 Tax=Flammeovirga sp. MY04 TaxID=1191459 RepID=UPI00082575BC|nr:hypothetical protein [Flammeovirga sp. MY04]ANQ51835.2 hypothetical protein MY04_4500 [Flammeovirga sp. MY04]
MKRLSEIESKIRDSEVVEFHMDWKIWKTDSFNQEESILIKFIKDKYLLILNLKGLEVIDLYESEFNSQYIENIKCFIDKENKIWFVLDPFDERIEEIEERDNFIIRCKEYELEINEIQTNTQHSK